jgi:3-methyladenine DNA glycosylase AlkD
MRALASPERATLLQRYFKTGPGEYGEGDVFLGLTMGQVSALTREFRDLPPPELEVLLESPLHEVRTGALKIMAVQAAAKKTPDERKRELFELYLRCTDRINNWDLVDISAPDVVGRYLVGRQRDLLRRLAASDSVWERRIAMISTAHFIRQGDLDDTFAIAEALIDDRHDLIHKAIGWMLRSAGDKDRGRLKDFLERHAAVMPRTALRYALEHFPPDERAYYMGLRRTRRE